MAASKEKARHVMPGLRRTKERRVGLAGGPHGRLFCCNDVWPFVVGLRVSFVLAGREELR